MTACPPQISPLNDDDAVANCFTSLRAIAAHDWRQFFEDVSRLEQILRDDPADVYAAWSARRATSIAKSWRRSPWPRVTAS